MRQPYEILRMTVEELVRQNPSAGAVLGCHNIDLCRCWGLSLQAAARTASVDPQTLADAVMSATPTPEELHAAFLVPFL